VLPNGDRFVAAAPMGLLCFRDFQFILNSAILVSQLSKIRRVPTVYSAKFAVVPQHYPRSTNDGPSEAVGDADLCPRNEAVLLSL
jgi:hypothetical protein